MPMQNRRFRWGRILLAVVAVYAALILLITIITTGYGVFLGAKAQGAPDQEKIAAFAGMLGASWTPWLGLVFTFIAALWASRRSVSPLLHGLLVGLLVQIIGLCLGSDPSFLGIALGALTIGAGILGGLVSARTYIGENEGTA
jgi:hypothetical protein